MLNLFVRITFFILLKFTVAPTFNNGHKKKVTRLVTGKPVDLEIVGFIFRFQGYINKYGRSGDWSSIKAVSGSLGEEI